MFTRLSNSWQLVKASAAVLSADKELLIFPIIAAIGSIIVMLTFAVPMFLAGIFDAFVSEQLVGLRIVGYLIGFTFYLVQYTVIIFCNSALVGAAHIRLKGGDPTVSDGFRIAAQHIGPILGYAAISATVGLILRNLSERGGMIGRLAASLIGLAWNVATYLAVPVLVIEGVGPLEAVKRSVALLKKTWGEQIVGNFGINTIFGLLTMVVIFLIGLPLIFVAIASQSVALIVVAVGLLVLLLVAISLISSALGGIYSAALYQYAVSGEAGKFFDDEMIRHAFRQK